MYFILPMMIGSTSASLISGDCLFNRSSLQVRYHGLPISHDHSDGIVKNIGFLILFWNLGVLRVVETMRMASRVLATPSHAQTANLAVDYEERAVGRIVAITERINDASAHGDVRLSDASEDKLPLMSHHANTGLTALALSSAIEHAITGTWLAEKPSTDYLEPTNPPALTSKAMESIKTLLAGLSTLHRTISGECVARPALRNLLRRYGDIIMDCWDESFRDI